MSATALPVKSSVQVGETSVTSNIVAIPVVRASPYADFLVYMVTVL